MTKFNQAHIFSGPSLYFHRRTIERLRGYRCASEAIQHDQFIESLYATLTSWGMHRMGPKGAKLTDYERFKAGFAEQHDQIRRLETLALAAVAGDGLENLTARVWEIISGLQISTTHTQIVAGSKALHHVLPDLVPPIDRQYTVQFFYGYARTNPDQKEFVRIFSNFHAIAVRCRDEIRSPVSNRTDAGEMNTSATKIIDNAIVGYALYHPKWVQLPQDFK